MLKYFMVLSSFFVFGLTNLSMAMQSDESEEKPEARMTINYTNYNNYGPRLINAVRIKVDGVYQGISGVRVNYYSVENDEERDIGFAMTDKKGEAHFGLPDIFYHAMDTTDHFYFIARVEDDPLVSDADAEIELSRSKISLEATVEDSIKTLTFYITYPDPDTREMVPAQDVEVSFYVKRLFGLLPIALSEYTDEDGMVSISFPDDIPGDNNRNLMIYAKIEEHEDFGTLIATTEQKWGVSLIEKDEGQRRALWSSGGNAPISLILIVSSLVLLIWGVIAFLLYEIFLIKKLGAQV